MLSAGLNFGTPEDEYIIEAENGVISSARNVITNTEFAGGGIPTYNIKIEVYDTGTNELVDYTLLGLGYFFTDTQNDDNYGFTYDYSNIAPEDHIYKAPVIGDKILFESDREIIAAGDGQNSWIPDPDADLIRSVSGSAVKEDLNVTISGDCTITINVIQD